MKRIIAVTSFLFVLVACSTNNVTTDNSLKRFFDEHQVNGSFAIFDNGTGEFTVYNLKRYRDSSFLPGNSFDIVLALTGLQTGKISNDSMKINGMSMYSAFQNSDTGYFREIARRIGMDTLQKALDTISYGTKKIQASLDNFWFDNSLKITPDEQLGLVKKLYFRQLPYFESYQDIVRNAMRFEDNSNYKLYYKYGSGKNEKGDLVTWVSGWIEENKHPYFFVLNAEGTLDRNISIAMLNGILKQLGFMQGKM